MVQAYYDWLQTLYPTKTIRVLDVNVALLSIQCIIFFNMQKRIMLDMFIELSTTTKYLVRGNVTIPLQDDKTMLVNIVKCMLHETKKHLNHLP